MNLILMVFKMFFKLFLVIVHSHRKLQYLIDWWPVNCKKTILC